jgi:AraC-like DNA-binding protein
MMEEFDAEVFLERVDWRSLTRELSDCLVEEAFFMKDRSGRFVMQNRRACEYCDAAEESETLGKTDADYWSGERAANYVEGDQMVMRSGQAIFNQLAPAPEDAGSDTMVIYSKFPVRDLNGQVVGVAGVHRVFDKAKALKSPFGALFKAVRRMQEDYGSELKIADLARLSGLSHSQFVRRFNSVLGMSPKDYLQRIRVRKACRLLEATHDTVADVAHQCGFYDHSHFSHAFRSQTGLCPSEYRKEHVR